MAQFSYKILPYGQLYYTKKISRLSVTLKNSKEFYVKKKGSCLVFLPPNPPKNTIVKFSICLAYLFIAYLLKCVTKAI